MSRHNSWFVRLQRTRIAFGQSGAEIPVPDTRESAGGNSVRSWKRSTRRPRPGTALRLRQLWSAAAALRIPVTIERHREGFQSDNSFLPLRAAPTKLGTNPPLSNEGKSRPAAGASPAMPPLPPGSAGLREGRTDRRTDGRTDGLPHPRRSRPGGGGGPRGSEFPRGAESAARGGGAGGSAGLGAPLHLLPAGTSPSRAGPGRAEPALTRVLHVVSSREGPKSAREGCARRGSAGCAGAGQGF